MHTKFRSGNSGLIDQGSNPGLATLLEQEVCFWRDLLVEQERNHCSSECLERIQQALALAEYRLAAMATAGRH